MKKIIYSLIAIVAMTACSSTDEPARQAEADTPPFSAKYLTEDEAVKMAQSALIEFGFSKGSRSNGTANVSLYRSHASRSAESDTAFYIVNFTNGGFAVVAADKAIGNPVFGVGPGQFEVSSENGTSDYMETVALYAVIRPPVGPTKPNGPLPLQPADSIPRGIIIDGDFGNYFQLDPQKSFTTECTKYTNTDWGQEHPYNFHCPNWCLVGCGPLTVGQLMTYYKKPSSLEGHSFNWDLMLSSRKLTDDSPYSQIDMTALMLRLIGKIVRTSYGFDQSFTDIRNVLAFFHNYGYSSAYFTTNTYTFMNQLSNHGPFLMTANTNLGYGHAWVVDGYRHIHEEYDEYDSNKRLIGGCTKDLYYFRMNWGENGCSNGYFRIDNKLEVTYTDEDSNSSTTIYNGFEGIVGLTK